MRTHGVHVLLLGLMAPALAGCVSNTDSGVAAAADADTQANPLDLFPIDLSREQCDVVGQSLTVPKEHLAKFLPEGFVVGDVREGGEYMFFPTNDPVNANFIDTGNGLAVAAATHCQAPYPNFARTEIWIYVEPPNVEVTGPSRLDLYALADYWDVASMVAGWPEHALAFSLAERPAVDVSNVIDVTAPAPEFRRGTNLLQDADGQLGTITIEAPRHSTDFPSDRPYRFWYNSTHGLIVNEITYYEQKVWYFGSGECSFRAGTVLHDVFGDDRCVRQPAILLDDVVIRERMDYLVGARAYAT